MKNDAFINQYIALVKSVAGKYRNSAIPFEDIMQEGLLGLLEAKKKFNPERKIQFTTYAYPWINKRIREFVSKESKKNFLELSDSIINNTLEEQPPETTKLKLPDNLDKIEKSVLKCFFEKRLPLDKIGLLLGLRRERVRQIKQKALRKMKINTKLI
ncbi:MAG: hypothetical protein A3J83_06665 [Elusimicrobia bacterium RIFOXYA2_FULL_40_6]|nr:MAG: hypothetical protein A3J83_06665 [Elusimicrobia bacterium RIFOXYA2_FULL_40_6]